MSSNNPELVGRVYLSDMRRFLLFTCRIGRFACAAAGGIFAFLSNSAGAQEAQFRAVGGPGLERGEVVVPHATGAFLVCNSKLPEVDLLRGYIVHYDSDLNVDWTRLLPCPALLQDVITSWSESAGTATVLTRELTLNDGYQTVFHRLDSLGTWLESTTLNAPQNFNPVARVEWLGTDWIVGEVGSQPTAVQAETGVTKTWGGEPGFLDEVTDAVVANNVLVAVGSRTQDDTTRTAIWGVYPLGQLAFETVGPDTAAGAWSQANAVAFNGQSLRVLHSYRPDAPDDEWLLHSMLSVNLNTGLLNGTLYGPLGGQRPGRDLAWTPQGWVKLTQTDGFAQLDRSMLVTHYNPNGTYVSQGAWGTIFEDDPSQVTQGPDGAIWVAGSTRGAIDGTWNACLLRLDSLGPLGSWASDLPGFGVYDDPLFDDVLSVETVATEDGWSCAPNPASGSTTLRIPVALSASERAALAWTLHGPLGRPVRTGLGTDIDLRGLNPGSHFLRLRHRGLDVHVKVLVVGVE